MINNLFKLLFATILAAATITALVRHAMHSQPDSKKVQIVLKKVDDPEITGSNRPRH